MDSHVTDFFSNYGAGEKGPSPHYHDVIPLHEKPELSWELLYQKAPLLSKGWYELSKLSEEDRVGFSFEYWSSRLPFHPTLNESLSVFFQSLDDIGIFLCQKKVNDPYIPTMVYSIRGDGGFYRGELPASYNDCMNLQEVFPDYIFPEDYFAFLQIHNGFKKTTDTTGILTISEVGTVYHNLLDIVKTNDVVTASGEVPVDPKSLIPFYESFGMPHFQCFWGEWHHEQGMGNVYYSVNDFMISDPSGGEIGSDNLAFATFSDWLVFYLERIV